MQKNKPLQVREMVKDDIAAFANYWVLISKKDQRKNKSKN